MDFVRRHYKTTTLFGLACLLVFSSYLNENLISIYSRTVCYLEYEYKSKSEIIEKAFKKDNKSIECSTPGKPDHRVDTKLEATEMVLM